MSHLTIEYQSPSTMPPTHGYSQVVAFSGTGKMVMVSGQVSEDQQGNIVGKNNMEAQTHQIFKNIQMALEVAGGNLRHLVKLNTYLKDISQIGIVRKVREQYVNTGQPPTSTTVQVVLDDPDLLIEIEAWAIIP